MGWISRADLSRSGRDPDPEPRPEIAQSLFSRVIHPLLQQLPERCVLDGEVVIARNGALDFDALQLRIHPAASRVKLLAKQTPSSFVCFDLLAEGDEDLCGEAFHRRRARLEELFRSAAAPLHLTPATRERAAASDWFRRFEGAGLDGVMVKPLDGAYEPGKRVMFKVKHERDCDCVVAGFRRTRMRKARAIGSLLLGLFDESRTLQHVGVCASFTKENRRELSGISNSLSHECARESPWGFVGRR